jgi:hypothetical protein
MHRNIGGVGGRSQVHPFLLSYDSKGTGLEARCAPIQLGLAFPDEHAFNSFEYTSRNS